MLRRDAEILARSLARIRLGIAITYQERICLGCYQESAGICYDFTWMVLGILQDSTRTLLGIQLGLFS